MPVVKTPIGNLRVKYEKDYIVECYFTDKKSNTVIPEFDRYFNGETNNVEVKFKMNGTDFQKKVWAELLKIKPGHTKTYSEIAKAIGNPNSCRAVANACGANKLPIVIPCHRVVGKNNLGGYNCGLERKVWLLDEEECRISQKID
jgi:methylated-DNA-[protein]-cysteine S-methyltransferase